MTLSPEEARAFEDRWRKALVRPYKVRALTPLPRRVRARLAVTHARDAVAAWLVVNVHWRAGALLWRATGAWRKKRR